MIVAVDLETTGLYPETCQILEIAIIILEDDLTEIDRKEWVLSASSDVLSNMNEFCTEMHTKSGLIEQCKNSGISLSQVEQELHDFFEEHDVQKTRPPLLGNSVHFDRSFLKEHLPSVLSQLSYRNIDVSSIKECLKRWNPDLVFDKDHIPHRALADLELSLKEIAYYKSQFLESKD